MVGGYPGIYCRIPCNGGCSAIGRRKGSVLSHLQLFGRGCWLAGAIAYYSVLFAYQRKTKQRSVAWLPLSVAIAALAGLIWSAFITGGGLT